MSGFAITVEDPFYDDNGVLIEEDSEWEDLVEDEYIDPAEWDIAFPQEDYNPFDTVNS